MFRSKYPWVLIFLLAWGMVGSSAKGSVWLRTAIDCARQLINVPRNNDDGLERVSIYTSVGVFYTDAPLKILPNPQGEDWRSIEGISEDMGLGAEDYLYLTEEKWADLKAELQNVRQHQKTQRPKWPSPPKTARPNTLNRALLRRMVFPRMVRFLNQAKSQSYYRIPAWYVALKYAAALKRVPIYELVTTVELLLKFYPTNGLSYGPEPVRQYPEDAGLGSLEMLLRVFFAERGSLRFGPIPALSGILLDWKYFPDPVLGLPHASYSNQSDCISMDLFHFDRVFDLTLHPTPELTRIRKENRYALYHELVHWAVKQADLQSLKILEAIQSEASVSEPNLRQTLSDVRFSGYDYFRTVREFFGDQLIRNRPVRVTNVEITEEIVQSVALVGGSAIRSGDRAWLPDAIKVARNNNAEKSVDAMNRILKLVLKHLPINRKDYYLLTLASQAYFIGGEYLAHVWLGESVNIERYAREFSFGGTGFDPRFAKRFMDTFAESWKDYLRFPDAMNVLQTVTEFR